jgi:hypothetical protein
MPDSAKQTEGICRNCGARILWAHSAKQNRIIPLELKRRVILDDHGHGHAGHESHLAYCTGKPKPPPRPDTYRLNQVDATPPTRAGDWHQKDPEQSNLYRTPLRPLRIK